jgi:hypothetical protein
MKGKKRVIEKEKNEFNSLKLKKVMSKNIGMLFLVIASITVINVNKLMP